VNNLKSLPILIILGAIGVLALLAATRFGIGITPDSTVYIDAAHSLMRGDGLSVLSGTSNDLKPLTHYPPLYSCLLALIGTLGVGLPTAARWLNSVLFGANIFLVGLIIGTYARQVFWLPVLGSFLTLTAPDVLLIHSFALTEPLFICFVLIGLLCLAFYIDNQQRRFLIAASVAMALSFLTRYVGIVSLLSGLVVILIFNSASLRRRLMDAVVFGVISCTPIGLWAVRNHFATGGATDRQFVFHPVPLHQLVSGSSTIAWWFLLSKVRTDIRVTALLLEVAAIAGLTIYLVRRRRRMRLDSEKRSLANLPHILLVFIVLDLGFLVFTATFIDADTVFDHRSLLPVRVAALAVVPCLARNVYLRSQPSRLIRLTFVALAVIFAVAYSVRGAKWLLPARRDGQGYASRTWRESATIAQVRSLPAGVPIYSNGYDAIYYLTNRRAILIPERTIHGTGHANVNYDLEIEKMRDDLREHNGFLVYFDTLPERRSLPSEGELKERLSLRLAAAESDGSIYFVESRPEIKSGSQGKKNE
jgi:hypothetical protein